jgi:RimJ/RimL family protein N-acetyltransferase
LARSLWEVSKKLINIAFDNLHADEVFAITEKDNIASRKVMEKLGLIYSHEFIEEDSEIRNVMTVFYSLKKSHIKSL